MFRKLLDQFPVDVDEVTLNPQMRDLANRYNVNTSTCLFFFSSWLAKGFSYFEIICFLPDQGVINDTKPP